MTKEFRITVFFHDMTRSYIRGHDLDDLIAQIRIRFKNEVKKIRITGFVIDDDGLINKVHEVTLPYRQVRGGYIGFC